MRRKDEPAIKATKATPGHYVAARPLEIVQIDHTRVDVVVVDEETGQTIGRPWITLAIDVFTRMVTGFHLTMAAPSRLSTGLALLHAVRDKTAWLNNREIKAPWPVAGLPETFCARTMVRTSTIAHLCELAATPASRSSGASRASRTTADISNV